MFVYLNDLLNKIFFIKIKIYKNYYYIKEGLLILHTIIQIYVIIYNYVSIRDISDILFL